MKWSELPLNIKFDIAQNYMAGTIDQLSDLNKYNVEALDSMSQDDLLERYLNWHGIVGYTSWIKQAVLAICKEDSP